MQTLLRTLLFIVADESRVGGKLTADAFKALENALLALFAAGKRAVRVKNILVKAGLYAQKALDCLERLVVSLLFN